MNRLNRAHKAVLRQLLNGPDTRVGIAIHTHMPWKEVRAALRGLAKAGYVDGIAMSNWKLTLKGEMLAKAHKKQEEARHDKPAHLGGARPAE